jgi:hypothetical protein
MIRHYINYQQNNWDELLPGLEHAYNSSVHATTGLAPFMMTFGQIPRSMADILIQPSSTSVECVSEFVSRMQVMGTNAVASIEQANKTAKGYANRSRRNFQFGLEDGVLLSTKYFIPEAFRDRKRKSAAKFACPYEIVEVIPPVAYRLRLPIGTKAHEGMFFYICIVGKWGRVVREEGSRVEIMKLGVRKPSKKRCGGYIYDKKNELGR